MVSLNHLLKQIKAVATAHTQINNYAEGQRYDFSASTALSYPCLWAIPTGVTPNIAGKRMDYRVTLVMMDIERTDGSNQIDILNDTALILTDVVALLENTANGIDDWEISSIGNFEPFVDAAQDTVSGHTCEVTFSTFYEANTCTDIFDGYTPPVNALETDDLYILEWY